jgi:hypothetical protein
MTGALCFIMLWLFTIFVSSPLSVPKTRRHEHT